MGGPQKRAPPPPPRILPGCPHAQAQTRSCHMTSRRPSPLPAPLAQAHLAVDDVPGEARGLEAPAGGHVLEGTVGQEAEAVGATFVDDEPAAVEVAATAKRVHTLGEGGADEEISRGAAAGVVGVTYRGGRGRVNVQERQRADEEVSRCAAEGFMQMYMRDR